jgi:pyridinium-3,5-bisthiocarboxylic acid mononucleotide nickel chelatase
MRIAYLDCFAGISGDMFLGALIDAGVDPAILHEAVAALDLNATLKIEKVDRSGISSTKIHVYDGAKLAEENSTLASPVHNHPHEDDQDHQHIHTHQHQPKTQHQHKAGHAHDHGHSHGRSLTVIRDLISAASLAPAVKHSAIQTFELLGASEAKIHNVPVEKIHFHEVGAIDAIVDIVAASAGIHALSMDKWSCSPLNIGGGMVDCAHGRFPVPAPATADLLRGLPTYSAHIEKELVTPTGAAIIRALAPTFGPQPAMRVEQIGYGAGTRNPKDFPNVLRLSIGETTDTVDISAPPALQSHKKSEAHPHHTAETVTVLETALDDLSPQVLAYVSEQALTMGALDVMLTPVVMKKGRPGTLLTIICNPSERHALEQLVLRETSTLGVRVRQDSRVCLDRHHAHVTTAYGEIRVKVGTLDGQECNVAPEFEDCRAAAAKHNVPLKLVQHAAIVAYFK